MIRKTDASASEKNKKSCISLIKAIEKLKYPNEMLQLDDCLTWDDLQSYAESDDVQVFIVNDQTYVILAPNEVVDWCGESKHVFQSLSCMKSYFENSQFNVDLRQSTSFPIAEMLEKKGKLKILSKRKWTWSNSCPEIMYNCTCCFVKTENR